MAKPVDYADASQEVRAVYDDIKRSRNVPYVNNFWKYLARDPALLRRTWERERAARQMLQRGGALCGIERGTGGAGGIVEQRQRRREAVAGGARVAHPLTHRRRSFPCPNPCPNPCPTFW